MNRYLEMTGRLSVPDGQKERLMAAVLAAEPKQAKKVYRPWSFAKKALLAAVLTVLVTATVGAAAELAPWNDFFVERFGAGAADSPAAESVFQNVDVTSVCGDVALTVRQALGDEKTLYLLVDYQLPEDTDMAAVRAAWEADKGLHCAHFELMSGGDADWSELEGRSAADIRSAFRTWHAWSGKVEIVDVDPETRTVTHMISAFFLEKVSLRKDLVLLADQPPELQVGEEWTPLADHPAVVRFRPSYTAKAKNGKQTSGGVTYTAELTPLSIEVENMGSKEDLLSMENLRQKTVLVYRDGTEVPIKTLGSGGGGRGDDGTTYRESCEVLFEKLVDPSQVRSVRIGDIVEIPLS